MTVLFYCLLNFLLVLPPSFQAALDDQATHRFLLQTTTLGYSVSTVIITEGPNDGDSINEADFVVHFEVSAGIDVGLQCQLEYEGEVFRDWESCISPYPVHLADDGEYEFHVMADQGLGFAMNPIESRVWTLDRIPPTTVIDDPHPINSTDTSTRLHFHGHDNHGHVHHYECRLGDEEWERCTSPKRITELNVGLHVFNVRAVDNAGNVDPEPPGCSWIVLSSSGSASRSENTEISRERQGPSSEIQSDGDPHGDDGVVGQTRSNWLITLLLIVFLLIGIFFVCLACFKCCTRFKQRGPSRNRDGGGSQLTSLESEVLSGGFDVSEFSSMDASLPEDLHRFRYEELLKATGGFGESGILGEGGFGKVFAGTLENGTPVAVKKLEHSGQQGDREFFVEVTTLCRARHPNILNLLGVCVEDGNRACVFELMDWGSPRSLLDDGDPRFTWEARLKVAHGVARGLGCLHERVDPPIVHRDLKSENILMDRHGNPRISDFGLCTVAHHEARQRHLRGHAVTVGTIRGTYGYLAPEVIGSGRVSTKSDVYAFGVFLLELLTGRRPIETKRPSKEQDLVKWTLRHVDRMEKVIESVDPVISSNVSFVQITAFVELAASCLNFNPPTRPSASEAAFRLEQLMSFREQPPPSEAKCKKTSKGKMDELRVSSKLSESSGMIPTGSPLQSFPSEGELTPHAEHTAIASTSSGRIIEIEMLPKRNQDSPSDQQSPLETLSPTIRDHWDDVGPSKADDTASA